MTARTRRTRQTACATLDPHLQRLNREFLRYFQTYLSTRSPRLAIATIQTVMAMAGLAPGATAGLAVRTGQAGIPGCTITATGINQQAFDGNNLQPQAQVTPR